MLKSLAGTDKKDYRPVQLAIREDRNIHIQGVGTNINRDYGVAADASVSKNSELAAYLGLRLALVPSQATGLARLYVPAQAAVRGNRVHFQFESKEANREYGAAFDIPKSEVPELATFLTGKEATGEQEVEEQSEPEQAAEPEHVHVGCGG